MFVWVKRLIVLSFFAAITAAGSFAGARFRAGKILGTNPPLGGRSIQFAYKGTADLNGNPRVWVITYATSRLPGVREARIYVSPTGKVIAIRPADLGDRLEAWARSQEP